MNTYSSPAAYKNCMSRPSMRARATRSPARKVRSVWAPVRTLRSVVRTKAAPLPGFTCKKSTTLNTSPSTVMVKPRRKSFTEIKGTTSLLQRSGSRRQRDEMFRRFRQHPAAVLRHDDEIFDADAAPTRDVHTRLHRSDHA